MLAQLWFARRLARMTFWMAVAAVAFGAAGRLAPTSNQPWWYDPVRAQKALGN